MLAGNSWHLWGFVGLKLCLCRGQNSATMALRGANQLLSPLRCFISTLHSILVALRIFWNHFLHQQHIWDGKIQFHVEAHSKLQGCGIWLTRKFCSLWIRKTKKHNFAVFLVYKLRSTFLRKIKGNTCGQNSVVKYNTESGTRRYKMPVFAGSAFFILISLTSLKSNPLTVKIFITQNTSQKLAVRHLHAF